MRTGRNVAGSCAILKSLHGFACRHPAPAGARRLGQRLAARGDPVDADRHRAARRRRAGGARGRPAPRGTAPRGHRAGARHASPPRPRRARRHDPAPLGRDRRRAGPGRRLCRPLRRRGRGGSPLRARADDAPRRPGPGRSPTPRTSGTTSARRPRRSRPTCGWPTAIACGPAGAASASWRGRGTAPPTHCSSTTMTRSRSPAITSWRRSPPTRRSARPTGRRTDVRARACATSRASSARGRCRSRGC